MIDQLLDKMGLKYENLNSAEKETLLSWTESLSKNQLTLEKVRDYIANLRVAIERELIDEPEFNYIFIFKVPNRNQILLKARLKNYLLLEDLLATPERAKLALERAVASIGEK